MADRERYIDGVRYVWDDATKTYRIAEEYEGTPEHASGGDAQLTDPAVHRMTPKNPDAVGILAPRHAQEDHVCREFTEYGYCTECGRHFLDDSVDEPVSGESPFPERVPIRDDRKWDDSFPTMASKRAAGPAITSDERRGMKKVSTPALIPAAMGALRALPMMGGGTGGAMGAAGGAGMAGGAAGGMGAMPGMAGLGTSMRNALTAKGALDIAGGEGVGMPAAGGAGVPAVIPPIEASAHTAGEGAGVEIWGEDSNPEYGLTDGYIEEHSGLELDLSELSDGAADPGTEPLDELVDDLIEIIPVEVTDLAEDEVMLLAGLEPKQIEALGLLGLNWPLVQQYADDDTLDGSDNPVIVAIDDALEEAFPGYKDEVLEATEGDEGADESDDSDEVDEPDDSDDGADEVDPFDEVKEAAVREARRLPRMCPHHKSLVETALALGDPAAAISAMSQHEFGEQSCNGGWEGDGDCKYKPQMTSQDYWDERAEKRQQRAEEKAQAEAEQAQQEPAEEDVLDYDFSAEDETAVDTPEESVESEEVVDVGMDLGQPVGEPVLASRTTDDYDFGFKAANVGTDMNGNPMKPGDTVTTRDGHSIMKVLRIEEDGWPVLQEMGTGTRMQMDPQHLIVDQDKAALGEGLDQWSKDLGSSLFGLGSKTAEKSDYEPANEGDLGDTPSPAPAIDGDELDSAITGGDENADIKDSKGRPIQKGESYLLNSPDCDTPDKVTVDHIKGDTVTVTINTELIDFQTDVTLADIEDGDLEFDPIKGDEPDEFESLPTDEEVEEIEPDVEIDAEMEIQRESSVDPLAAASGDLLWDVISKEAAKGSVKTAGTVTDSALREIMNEGEGVLARNREKLSLEGTHYEFMSDDDIADIFA